MFVTLLDLTVLSLIIVSNVLSKLASPPLVTFATKPTVGTLYSFVLSLFISAKSSFVAEIVTSLPSILTSHLDLSIFLSIASLSGVTPSGNLSFITYDLISSERSAAKLLFVNG